MMIMMMMIMLMMLMVMIILMVRSTLLPVTGGRQTAQDPILLSVGPDPL